MEKARAVATISHLRQSLAVADSIVREFYRSMMNRPSDPDEQGAMWEAEEEIGKRLATRLTKLGTEMSVALEVLGLPATQGAFIERWRSYGQHDLRHIDEMHHPDWGDDVWSDPLAFCQDVFDVISAPYASDEDVATKTTLDLLEYVLASTAKIVADRRVNVTKEKDVQDCMHDHLDNTFDSFTRTLTIPKSIVSFKPDGGVISLRAAIEFKFVVTRDEFKEAVRGLNEDLSGYTGSLDWTRFFAVIYQTEPFATEWQSREALNLSGNASNWSIIVVTGGGGRVAKRSK